MKKITLALAITIFLITSATQTKAPELVWEKSTVNLIPKESITTYRSGLTLDIKKVRTKLTELRAHKNKTEEIKRSIKALQKVENDLKERFYNTIFYGL